METSVTKGSGKDKLATGPTGKKNPKGSLAMPSLSTSPGETAETPRWVGVFGPFAITAHKNNARGAFSWLMLLVLPVVVSAASAFAISQFIPPVYAARTETILHVPQSGDAVVRYLASQVAIIKSPAVLDAVSAKSGITAEQIDEQLRVEFPKGGNVMRIQYANKNRSAALDVTQKILAQYELIVSQIEESENTSHQVLSPPELLEEPVTPRPLQLGAIGGAIGLLISLAAFALTTRPRRVP
jgi:capsular polysaccharide biosynthesis protein